MVITELQEKLITTKRGPAKKFVVKTDDGKMFDAFVNDWNKDWAVGQAISIDPDQWSSREYMGKMYYSVGAPRRNTTSTIGEIPIVPAGGTTGIMELINALARDIKANHEQVMTELEKVQKKEDILDQVPF